MNESGNCLSGDEKSEGRHEKRTVNGLESGLDLTLESCAEFANENGNERTVG